MKFEGTPHEDEVRKASDAAVAKQMGSDRKRPLRKDWEQVKVKLMRELLLEKFRQHEDIKKILLETGEELKIGQMPLIGNTIFNM